MGNSPPKPIRYQFGPFELDPGEGKLFRNSTQVKLQDLPLRFLILLLEHAGGLVTRDEVRQRLWPQNTFVEFDNSLGVAVRKLREALRDDADTPRFVQTVPRKGYRFIAPVKVLDSSEKSLANPPLVREEASVSDLKKTAGRGRYGMIAALVLLLVGGVVYEFRSSPRRSSSTAEAGGAMTPAHVRRSVAVLGFRNLPGRPDDNWLSAALSEMLSTELAAGGNLRLVAGEDVARAKRELPLADEDTLAKATLQRLRSNSGADVVVLGSYTLLPGSGKNRLRLDIRLQDTAAGETIAEDALTGSEENLFELASQAGVRLRQSLGVTSISPVSTESVRASLPATQQAFRLYTEGQSKLWAFDFVPARDLLVQATAADPGYPLVHSALSEVWNHLGYAAKAREEAQRALELSGPLSEENRLLIEGQYRGTISDWPKSIEAYKKLFNLFPDNLNYGLRLASAELHVSPEDSLRTLAALRRLPSPVGDDARIDLGEASVLASRDLTKARAAAEHAAEKGTAQGSHLLVARSYGFLCQQGAASGASMSESIADCEQARQSYAAAGEFNNEARTLSDFAGIYFQQGDVHRAESMWHEAGKEFRQVGDIEGVAASANNLGDALFLQGDLDGAKKLLEEAILNYQKIEDKDGVALALNDLGGLSREKGDLKIAETTYQQAKATAQEIDDKNAIGYILMGLGDVMSDRGDLAVARKSYEDSLALRKQIGESQGVAETEIALAELSIEEGRAASAEPLMRQCEAQFRREN